MKGCFLMLMIFIIAGCTNSGEKKSAENQHIKLITLDPGHFHAALVQKSMYDGVDSVVHMYAPQGMDVQLHLEKIESYNTRSENTDVSLSQFN